MGNLSEFELYSILDQIKNNIEPWAINDEIKAVCEDLDGQIERIKSRRFRVAVVGEFKRGKSSLINTLLKREILPADVRPTTATFNRVVYGSTPRAFLLLKGENKTKKEVPVDELEKYITELTEESTENARKIEEVVVEFPSMFCSDHVELIDTPGLNDNQEMTELTVGRLKDIDLAIVAVNATIPFSDTEANLIKKLLESASVCQIMFAVTMIDRIPKKDLNRLIDHLRKSICIKVMNKLKKTHEETDVIFEKYDSILKNPLIYGLSASQAQEALHLQNEELYIKSGYRKFADELPAILIASRSTSLSDNALRVGNDSIEKFVEYLKTSPQKLEERKVIIENFRKGFATEAYSRAELEKDKLVKIMEAACQSLKGKGESRIESIFAEAWNQSPKTERDRVKTILAVLPVFYEKTYQYHDAVLINALPEKMKLESRKILNNIPAFHKNDFFKWPEMENLLNEKWSFVVNDDVIDQLCKQRPWRDFLWQRSPLPVRYTLVDNHFYDGVVESASKSLDLYVEENGKIANKMIESLFMIRRNQIQTVVLAVFQLCTREIEKIQTEQNAISKGTAAGPLLQLQSRIRQMKLNNQ